MEPETTHKESHMHGHKDEHKGTHTSHEHEKKSGMSVPTAIIIGSVIVGIAIIVAFSPNFAPAKNAPTQKQAAQADTTPTSVPAAIAKLRSDDYIRGSASADIAVIEYGDSDCYYCDKFHPIMKKIVDDYKGKVVWTWRFLPLDSLHPNAYTEATALACVGQNGGSAAFNTYLDSVISITLKSDAKSNEMLTTLAQKAGVDAATFRKCMVGSTGTTRVDRDMSEASEIGAQGTPFSVVVNTKTGKQVIAPGAYNEAKMKMIIDSLLK